MRESAPRAAVCAARDNPFRVSRVLRLRYRLDDDAWGRLLERFEHLGRRAALVGPEGSGKSTLLEDLEERLEQNGWHLMRLRLDRERRRLSLGEWASVESAGRGDLITVDGFEQLAWWHGRLLERLSRRAGGLLVTSHRVGRLPVLREHRTDPEILEALVRDLVGRASAERLGPEFERLFVVHRGNLRDCLRSLYDLWPRLCAIRSAAIRGQKLADHRQILTVVHPDTGEVMRGTPTGISGCSYARTSGSTM